MNDLVGFYLRISHLYEYRATCVLLKTYLALEKYTFKQQQVQVTKYEKFSLQVECPVQSDLQLSLRYFLLMILTESLYIYFC